MEAYDALSELEPRLATAIARAGRPDPYAWADGGRTGTDLFAALVLHVIGQQIATPVAFVLYDRLVAAQDGMPSAKGLLWLGADRLRLLGFSRAKVSYLLALSRACADGDLDLDGLRDLPDERALVALTGLPGIGRRTAEMFLIFQLRRPDVFPAGDTGLRRAVRHLFPEVGSSPGAVAARAARWAPYRTHATAVLRRVSSSKD